MTFTGWPLEAFDFFDDLEDHNSRDWFTAHRGDYEAHVRAPMAALLADLEPDFGPGKIFRIHRDVRFSADKRPYKTHIGAYVDAPGGGYYVQFSAAGLHVAAGRHRTTPDQVARLRAAVDEEASGAALAEILADAEAAGCAVGDPELARVPRGFPADHPRAALLRHRTLTVSRTEPPGPWLHEPSAIVPVRETWDAARPLVTWLGAHVGESREPAYR